MFAQACPHMTNSRCSICRALDEIASMIEEHGTLNEKQVNRAYNLATGKVVPPETDSNLKMSTGAKKAN